MKIFADTADVKELREIAHLIDGVTTNPTLVSKTGRRFDEVAKEIVSIVDGPISLEVIGTSTKEMVEEAKKLAKIHKNVVVKIPMTEDGLKAVEILSKQGIKTNVTLIFSANQALLAAKAGASYVSPFIGRLDDIGQDGMDLVEEIIQIFDNFEFETEVLVASIRHAIHVKQAAMLGADVATIPYAVIKQMFRHSLTDSGLQRFLEDWKKVPK